MKHLILTLTTVLGLSACGVETATTAATVAAAKKQEIEEGQKTMAVMEGKIDAAMVQSQQRLRDADGGQRE